MLLELRSVLPATEMKEVRYKPKPDTYKPVATIFEKIPMEILPQRSRPLEINEFKP